MDFTIDPLFFSGEAKEQRDNLYDGEQKSEGSFSHEAIGAGVGFAAMHEWEKKQRAEGKPVNHAFAKEALAAAVGFETDKLFEKDVVPWAEKKEVERHARKQAEQMYDQQYGDKEEWHP